MIDFASRTTIAPSERRAFSMNQINKPSPASNTEEPATE